MSYSESTRNTHNTIVDPKLTRRQAIAGISGAFLTALLPIAVRAEEHAHTATPATTSSKRRDMVDAAVACVGTGEICLKHILDQSAAGDTSLAVCGMRVHDMVAVCRALATLAASDSPQLKPFAKVCIEVCQSCETECRKHEQHHPICKETADSCARVVATCKKLLA
jgi:Cys-rich four helix bundle protein (predicted Tat secretion target)